MGRSKARGNSERLLTSHLTTSHVARPTAAPQDFGMSLKALVRGL